MEITGQSPFPGRTISRRRALRYGAFTGAAAAVGATLPTLARPAYADAVPDVLPAPKPIPGGNPLPDGTVIHVFAPGPPTVTLPFSHLQLQGLDVEPNVITDFSGFTALAFHAGTATGSNGTRYDLETDMRVMKGSYRAVDGSQTRGTFGFV
jgi:hypothetical protein